MELPLLSKVEEFPKESSDDIAFRPYWFANHLNGILLQSGYKLKKMGLLSEIGFLLKDANLETIPQIKNLISQYIILEKP